MIIVQSARLYVRRYTTTDLEAFHMLNSDPELMRYIRPVMNFEQSKKFLEENFELYESFPSLGRWALMQKGSNEMVGSLSLLPFQNSEDFHIGYVLFKPYWGLGYAAEIVKAGSEYAFGELQLKSLTAITYVDNLPSQNVLLKNGFTFERAFFEEGKENRLYRLHRTLP